VGEREVSLTEVKGKRQTAPSDLSAGIRSGESRELTLAFEKNAQKKWTGKGAGLIHKRRGLPESREDNEKYPMSSRFSCRSTAGS